MLFTQLTLLTLFQLDVAFFSLIIVVPSSSSHSTSSSNVYPLNDTRKISVLARIKDFQFSIYMNTICLFFLSFFSKFVKRHALLNRQKSTTCHLKIYVNFRRRIREYIQENHFGILLANTAICHITLFSMFPMVKFDFATFHNGKECFGNLNDSIAILATYKINSEQYFYIFFYILVNFF